MKLVVFLNAIGFTSLLLRSSTVWPYHAEMPLLWEQQRRLRALWDGLPSDGPHSTEPKVTCAATREGSLALAQHHDGCGHKPSVGVETSCSASAPACKTDCNRGGEGKPHTGGNAGSGQMAWAREKRALPFCHPLTGDTSERGVGWLH